LRSAQRREGAAARMRVAVLVPGLAPHDAVSNDALGMTAALRRLGHEVALFAPHARGIDEPVHSPESIDSWLRSRDDVVLYHYCVGWDFPLALFRRTRARRILRYHNITPAEFFEGWSPGYVAACAEGRAQIDAYAALNCELYLGDSPFNIEDFARCGVAADRCAVLAPFHEVEQLLTLQPDARRIPSGAPLLLMVGRLSPNKRHLDLVDALDACIAGVAPDAHLLSIGKLDPNLASYGEALHARIAERGLESRVTLLQDANGAELRAAFERADALVMLSQHEGFCVPLIEAMALGTPVVALASSAMPWTLGDAGLTWGSAEPYLIAASIARIARDEQLRADLRERGRVRYATTFAPDVLAEGLRRIMERFIR
jgi:glycosyltransferase involved in cell wall biosynthesis